MSILVDIFLKVNLKFLMCNIVLLLHGRTTKPCSPRIMSVFMFGFTFQSVFLFSNFNFFHLFVSKDG